MKFLSTISAMATGIILCLGAASCNNNNDDPEFKVQQQITDSFIHVYDISQDVSANYKGVSYDIIYDYISATAQVTIKGLRLPGGEQYPSLKLTDVPFKVNDSGWRLLEGTDLKVSIDGFASVPQFNSFKLQILDRVIANTYYPAAFIAYTIDSHYRVVSSIPDQVLQGTTVTTGPDGKSFSNSEPIYVLQFDFDTNRASLTINGARFIQSMPAQNMTFPNIPFTIGNNGVITLEKKEANTPTIGGTPFPAFPISDFKAVCTLGEGMKLNFVCTPSSDKIGGPFDVSADLPYNFQQKQ